MDDTTKILLSIGGTVCAALIAALKILWNKVEFLTATVLESTAKLNRLEGRHEYMERLHEEVIEIVETGNSKS